MFFQVELTLIQIITICAIANGQVFSVLLLDKKENKRANRYLSLMILCMCLTFTPYMLDPVIWHTYRWLAWLPFSLSYWIGPAFYFYVKSLTQPSVPWKNRNWWHFTPIILNYLHSIYHAWVPEANPYPMLHHLAELLESAAIISVLIYCFLAYRKITAYQQRLLEQVSNLDQINLRWLKRIIRVMVSSFVGIFIFLVISSGISGKEQLNQWNTYRSLVLLFYSVILYGLSISGFRQAQTLVIDISETPPPKAPDQSHLILKLKKQIEEQALYRNPELSLSDLSNAVGLSERSISEAINRELAKNFYQFINEYRVAEVKIKLKDPQCNHLKIVSLALDAGFNSKASFNRVFKQYTGMTPNQYKKQKK